MEFNQASFSGRGRSSVMPFRFRDGHPLVSIVIPTFREAKRLPQTLQEICAYLQSRFPRHEVLIVDDPTGDGTDDLLARIAVDWPNLRSIKQPRRLGKGAAVRRGCMEAAGDLVLFMDADHATPIHEMEKLLECIEEFHCDVVAGIRTYQENESKSRRLIGLVAQLLAHLIVFKKAVVDSQCGFKLFTKDAVQRLFPLCRTDGGMLDVELFFLIHSLNLSCRYCPVHWANKDGSVISVWKCMLSDPIDMLKIRVGGIIGRYSKPVPSAKQPWNRLASKTRPISAALEG